MKIFTLSDLIVGALFMIDSIADGYNHELKEETTVTPTVCDSQRAATESNAICLSSLLNNNINKVT